MPAPHLDGKVSSYEEVWREHTVPASGTTSWILQSSDNKTFLGKIGGYYLALGEREVGGFSVLREDLGAENGRWRAKYKVGSPETLPSIRSNHHLLENEGGWKIGDVVETDNGTFTVLATEAVE